MMMTDLVPEVKNLDADHAFDDEAMRKTILAGEVLKKQHCVLARGRQQEKKVSGTMRGGADSLKLRKSQAGTTKTQ